ncbi:unnamed protein product, partial [Rotaria sp. Silwood2]
MKTTSNNLSSSLAETLVNSMKRHTSP